MPLGMSYADARNLIEGHLNKDKTEDDGWIWVKDLFDGMVVYEDDGVLYQASYTITEAEVTMGTPERVKTTYEKFAELQGVEVLRTGTFVSAGGVSVTFTEDDLDNVLSNFKDIPSNKVPIVVGHSEGETGDLVNAMTVGAHVISYMKELTKKTVDGIPVLVADFGDVAEKAIEMVGNQLVRISPEIFNNFIDNEGHAHGKAFKRIAFVDRSSIRELPDVTKEMLVFDEGSGQDSVVLFLSEESAGNKNKGGAQMTAEELAKFKADQALKFSEQETALADLKKKNEELQTEKDGAVTKLSEAALSTHKAGIKAFIVQLKGDGKVSPATEATLQAFMEALPHGESAAVIKLGEGDTAKSLDALGAFKEMVSQMPELIKFGEIAASDIDQPGSGMTDAEKEVYKVMGVPVEDVKKFSEGIVPQDKK